jgi:hypothetical protein
MQQGKITPGYFEDRGFIQPQEAGIIQGASNEEIREPFETKMDVEKQRTEYDGKTVNVRPKEKMFAQVGLNEKGEFTGQTKQEFNNWVADIGRERLEGYLQQTGRISPEATKAEVNNAAVELYKDTAKEVANRYFDYDVTRDEKENNNNTKGLFGQTNWYTIDESYRYGLPGLEKTLGIDKITQLQDEEIMELPQESLNTLIEAQNRLTQKGILDPDLDFEEAPSRNNFVYLKELLKNKINNVELSEDQIEDMKDLLGSEAHKSLGDLQTSGEIKNLKPEQAQEILNKINSEETRLYQSKISEKDAPSITAKDQQITALDLFEDEQEALRGTSFGYRPMIDAQKGIPLQGDYLDQGETTPRKIVSLPLERTEDDEWQQVEGGKRRLFLEVSGKVDPDNLSDVEKQRYYAASREEVPGEFNIQSQLKEKQDMLKSDKFLVPINMRLAEQIVGSTGSDRLRNEFEQYFGEQLNLRTSEFTSESL